MSIKNFNLTVFLVLLTIIKVQSQEVITKMQKLDSIYKLGQQNMSDADRTAFIQLFPRTGEEFSDYYGFSPLYGNNLRGKAAAHLELLVSFLDKEKTDEIANKLFSLAYKLAPNHELSIPYSRFIRELGSSNDGARLLLSTNPLHKSLGHLLFWQLYFFTNSEDINLKENYKQIYAIAKNEYPDILPIIEFAYKHFYNCRAELPASKVVESGDARYFTVLLDAAKSLQQNNSLENQQRFFDLIPENWQAFNFITYSSRRKNNYIFNISDYDSHLIVKMLEKRNLASIKSESLNNKLLKMAYGGYWDADEINWFQVDLMNKLMSDDNFINSLESKQSMEQILFLEFLFSSSTRDKNLQKKYDRIIERLTKSGRVDDGIVDFVYQTVFMSKPHCSQ
ncbi:MAG: hypothetical protein ACRDDZ_06850 [Marinifilaceae bacterium]